MKIIRPLAGVLLLLVLLCGTALPCLSKGALQGKSVRLIDKDYFSETAFIDGKIIYYCLEDQNTLVFKRFDPSKRETVLLGKVPGFYASVDITAYMEPDLYFFCAAQKPSGSEVENVLCQINIQEPGIKLIHDGDGCLPGTAAYGFQGKVLTQKNYRVQPNQFLTSIGTYDPQTGQWQCSNSCRANSRTMVGESNSAFCSAGDQVYLLRSSYQGEEGREARLSILDKQMKEQRQIPLSKACSDDLFKSFITEMQVYGDYVFIQNASNYGYLGKIKDDSLVEVHKDRNFCFRANHASESPIFFTRGAKSVYYIDKEATLRRFQLPLAEDQNIVCIFGGEDSFLVLHKSEGGKVKRTIYQRGDLEGRGIAMKEKG